MDRNTENKVGEKKKSGKETVKEYKKTEKEYKKTEKMEEN